MDLPTDEQLVYVPARPMIGGAERGVGIETRQFVEGTPFAIAFTSDDALVAALGENQPWMCLPMAAFAAMLDDVGIHRVQIDPELDDTVWRWSSGELEELEREQR